MGSRVLEFPVATGGTLLVEVDDPQVGNRPVSRDEVIALALIRHPRCCRRSKKSCLAS